MVEKKFCPKCGEELSIDSEFCTECGFKIKDNEKTVAGASSSMNVMPVKENGIFERFFDNVSKKTSFPILVFAFVIFGIFLFIGSFVWGSFLANQSINFETYLFLTIIFSVFFGGVFIGYAGCIEKSYIFPNFSVYLGSIAAILLCGFGLIFSIIIGYVSVLSSIYNSFYSGGDSSYYDTSSYGGSYSSGSNEVLSNAGYSLGSDIILFLLFIPVAAYIGIYLGYLLRGFIK